MSRNYHFAHLAFQSQINSLFFLTAVQQNSHDLLIRILKSRYIQICGVFCAADANRTGLNILGNLPDVLIR